MQETSIKNVSTSDLEAAIAETIERLTGKPWSVRIDALVYPKTDGVVAALYGNPEKLTLELSAQVKAEQPPVLSDFAR